MFPFIFPDLFSARQLDSQFEVPTGLLLYGAPGNGKTKIARCLASEAKGTTFIAVSGADINGMYVGDTEKAIKSLFQMATALQHSILFIDEAESLFVSREGKPTEHSVKATCEFLSCMQEQKGISSIYYIWKSGAGRYPSLTIDSIDDFRQTYANAFVGEVQTERKDVT